MLELTGPAIRLGATAVVVLTCLGGPDTAVAGPAIPVATASVGPALTVHGRVLGLYPGAHKWMRVTVRNISRSTLVVRSIVVRVRDASSACRGTNVRILPFHGRVRVRASRTKRLRLRARMRRSAPDACQRVRFPLTFSAEAVPA